MSKKLLLIFGVLPQLMMGQYTYFNDGYLPPFPEIGSGQSVGLFVKNDTVVTYGYAPFDDGYGRTIIFLNDQGEQIENLIYPEGNIIQSLNYSDVAVKTATGYVYSGGENGYPIIVWQGGFFEELYRMSYDELFTDTTYGEFFSNTKSMDEAIISSGRLIYDLNPDIPGQDFTTLILTKHDLQGNEIWYKEHSLEELGIDDSYYQIFPRGGVFELENHNILVFTSIGNDLDCCVLKFDSLGNYVDHVKWGNTTYSDGNPWPVQISENEFLFSYNIFSNMSGDYFMYKPRIGKLNTVDMSIQVFPLLDHPFCYGQLTDFEATPDGNYAILGYGYNPDGEDMGRAFIIKVDELGNEIWF